jgi:hypothetical protein
MEGDNLRLSLPRDLIDVTDASATADGFQSVEDNQAGEVIVPTNDGSISSTFVIIATLNDGKTQQMESESVVQDIDNERIVEIPLNADTDKVEIYGTYVTPEFSALLPTSIVAAIVITSIVAAIRLAPKLQLY